MTWTKRLFLSALLPLACQPAIATVIVIRANGPSATHYPAGRTLADTTRLVLQKGDEFTLLDAQGTRVVTGPANILAKGSATEVAQSRLVALATTATDRRARVGAVRNLPGADSNQRRPNIFMVDVGAPGKVCVEDPHSVSLWRADAGSAASMQIVPQDGPSVSLSWIKGQSTLAWPANVPIVENRNYTIVPMPMPMPGPAVAASGSMLAKGSPSRTTLTFRFLATPPADMTELAGALIARGCQGQIDLLVATTSAPPSPAGS